MAYLIFTANGEEFDRRELRVSEAAVLGRAPDCDISIPDIMLSRRHCRVEPINTDDGLLWRIVDLQSKNGTFLRGRAISTHELHDGDELRLGRTRITFRGGAFVAPPATAVTPVRRRAVARPADPVEALAGTVSGMVLCEPDEVEKQACFPYPQPRPADPSAYASDDIYGMIEQIASSSWDSIMAQNSQPIRMQRVIPSAAMTQAKRGAVRPKPRVSFCLQAEHRHDAGAVHATDARSRSTAPENHASRRTRRPRRPWLWVTGSVAGTIAFMVLWVTVILSASNTGDSGAWRAPAAAGAHEQVSPVANPTPTIVPPADATPTNDAGNDVAPVEWDTVAESA